MKPIIFLVALAALAFAEVGLTVFLAQRLGAWNTFEIYAVPTLLGLAIQRFRWPEVREALTRSEELLANKKHPKQRRKMFNSSQELRRIWTTVGLFWGTTFLLFIPGPLTALIAFVLMFPAIRNAFVEAFSKMPEKDRPLAERPPIFPSKS